jgi:MFS family permease
MFNRARRTASSTFGGLPAPFWIVWVGTLINRIGLMVVPFLTLFLTRQRGFSPAEATLVVSLVGVGSFIAAFIGGMLADRLGRKPTVVASMLMAAVCMLILPTAESLPIIALVAGVLGFFTDLYRPAVSAIIADLIPPEDRIRAFSLLYWVINLGVAIAPLLASLALVYGYGLLFVIDAATTFAYGLLVWWRVPETRPAEARAASAGRNPFKGYGAAIRDRRLVLLTLLSLLIGCMGFQAYTTLPLHMEARGLTEADYALTISLNGLIIVLFALPVAAWATRRARFPMLALTSVLSAVGFGVFAFADSLLWVYLLGVAIFTLGEVAYAPVGNAVVSDMAPVAQRGSYMGLYGMSWGLAAAIGPALGGIILAAAGGTTLWVISLSAGLLAALGFVLLGRQPVSVVSS